jgi:purine-cytosine permease-like protein
MPIEQRGVDTIPDEERTSGPKDLVSILLGSNLCLGVIIFGWLPPSFGLDWWSSVSAIVAGTVIGTALPPGTWSRCCSPRPPGRSATRA